MLKEHIIATTIELFARNGIRKVSMDDIARKAGVSKRTLYEFFDNKESLLIQIIDTCFNQAGEYFARLRKGTYTALEIFLLFNEKMMERPVLYCEEFHQDMRRYPEAYKCLMCNKQKFLDLVTLLLKDGSKEGLFSSDIDFDIIALLMREQMNLLQIPWTLGKYNHTEVRNTLFLIFIRGICTDAGWKILESYNVKKQFKT
jgi:AcrR family transcriptional regulator